MRVLVLFAHPVPESYGAALQAAVIEELTRAGHEIDNCDLHAEGFDPVLSMAERRGYHDLAHNTDPVASHVARLRWAEVLIVVTPVWNFGWPAILKGYLDRVFLPGVSFRLENGKVTGALTNIRRLMVVTTYGADRWRAMLAGDPPRKIVKRVLAAVTGFQARIDYLAHYDMNRSTDVTRGAFLAKVRTAVAKLS